MNKYDDWFYNAPACVQEDVTGILLSDYNNDYDAHTDAVCDWWDELNEKEKEQLYKIYS